MSDMPRLTTVPRDLYYHEIAYVRGLEAKVADAAAFLDALASRLDAVVQAGCIAEDDADQAAADCRKMAARLRGQGS